MPFILNRNPNTLTGTLAQIPSVTKLPIGTVYQATDGGSFMVTWTGTAKVWTNMEPVGLSAHYVHAVSSSNQATMSGLAQTVDGVALSTAGMRVLLAAQLTGSQNGIWVVAAGAWTRPSDWYTGDTAQPGTVVEVGAGGTSWAGSSWKVQNTGVAIIGTNTVTLTPRIQKGTQALSGGTAVVSNLFVLAGAGLSLVDQTAAAAVKGVLVAGQGSGTLTLTGTTTDTISYTIHNW